jgi:hypothetical protein
MVLIDTINAHSCIDAHGFLEDRITDACVHHKRTQRVRPCARACGCVGCARICAEPCEPCLSVWTACGFGAQAFGSASAFNANIGAWNTASVSNMIAVCATFGRRRAAAGVADALGQASMRRGRLCAAAPPMCDI